MRTVVLTWLRRAFVAATALAFVAHFALTVAYVSPLTPAKMLHEDGIMTAINAYAQQTWTLFAPEPAAANQSMLVRCLDHDAVAAATGAGAIPETGWEDVTAPLIRAHQAQRISPYDRVARPQINRIREFLSGPSDLPAWHHACEKGDKEACDYEQHALDVYRRDASLVLMSIASSYCFEVGADDTEAVAVRIRSVPGKPWSRRDETTPEPPEDYDIGIYPVVRGVVPSGIYARRGS